MIDRSTLGRFLSILGLSVAVFSYFAPLPALLRGALVAAGVSLLVTGFLAARAADRARRDALAETLARVDRSRAERGARGPRGRRGRR